jgi:hypothetical protein
MIRQERLDELKRYDDPGKFFDDFLCDVNIIVKQHREDFEARASCFREKRLAYKAAVDELLKEREKTRSKASKKPPQFLESSLPCGWCDSRPSSPDVYEQYQRRGWKIITVVLEAKETRERPLHTHRLLVPPDFPDDPSLWFLIYDTHHRTKAIEVPVCSPEDELLRGYVALALLYNEQAKERGETLIAPDILSGTKAQLLGLEIPQERVDVFYWTKVRNALINDFVAVDGDLASKQKKEAQKPAEPEQNTTPAKIINIENSNVIMGNIQQPGNLQVGDYASIHKYPKIKKKGILKRIPRWIYYILGTLAALVTVLHLLGLLEPIKRLFTR